MESCRENCPIVLALRNKISEKVAEKQDQLDRALQLADRLAETDNNDTPSSIGEAIGRARLEGGAVFSLKNREALMRSKDDDIKLYETMINLAVDRCKSGVKYERHQ